MLVWEELKAFYLDSVDQRLVEAAIIGMEWAKDDKVLEAKVEKLKAIDHHIDRKLECTKLHFQELKNKLKSSV